jgi:hypothetical protein
MQTAKLPTSELRFPIRQELGIIHHPTIKQLRPRARRLRTIRHWNKLGVTTWVRVLYTNAQGLQEVIHGKHPNLFR